MIKVAVIGVGQMGKNHARVYSQLKGVKLIAVSDLNEKAGKEVAEKCKCNFYSDYNEMLRMEKLNAISVVVPTAQHKEVALDVINAGVNLLVEKPLAFDIEEARQIINAADKKGVKLMVGHVERFNPAVQKLKQIIASGKLGDITSIVARRVGLFPPRIRDANVVIDLAVHDIDICNYLLNKEPKEIFAKAGKALTNKREDYADIFLKYDDINALIQVNWITPVKIRTLAVTGTKGYAELNYITQELRLYESIYEKFIDGETFEQLVKFTTPKIRTIKINKKEPLKEELRVFLECIRKRKNCPVGGKEGLSTLKIAQKIIEAYTKNKVVRL